MANYKENESKLEKDKEHLEKVLEAALAKLFPEKYGEKSAVNMDCLTLYVQENCTMWWMEVFFNPPIYKKILTGIIKFTFVIS